MTTTDAASPDAWNPATYGTFAAERSQPFRDLVALVRPLPAATSTRAVDLGCGSGELTAYAADQLERDWSDVHLVGIDNSPAMLAAAQAYASASVRFEAGDLAAWTGSADHDLVLANASLQWVPDHAGVLARWTRALAPGGQLAVQVPANAGQASHLVAAEVAHREPFLSAFGGAPPPDPVAEHVLEPEAYAAILDDLGFTAQHVRLQVYPHHLASTSAIVDWVRGTTLTRFQRVLPPALFDDYLVAYRARLIDVLGDRSPCFFPFRRILMWGRLPG